MVENEILESDECPILVPRAQMREELTRAKFLFEKLTEIAGKVSVFGRVNTDTKIEESATQSSWKKTQSLRIEVVGE